MILGHRSLGLLTEEVSMFTITEAAENPSRLLGTKPLEPAARLDDAVCIARAIAKLMDPEWREVVEQEQRKRRMSSSSPSEA
jgi:hypothetical protein